MDEAAAGGRWRLPEDCPIEWRRWDDEYVVHHPLSNDTHRLSETAGRLLEALQRSGCLDLDAIAGRCGVDREEAAALLDALAELDLVTRC